MSSKEEYLKRYLSGSSGGGKVGGGSGGMATDTKKKKRKKRPGGLEAPAVKAKVLPGAIKMVDNDVSLASLVAREEDDEEGEEEAPVVVESAAARKAREVQERLKNYYVKGADGSGWEAVAELTTAAADDLSPPRRRARHDSPQDLSPPRRGGGADLSPPRRPSAAAAGRAPGADLSPPRRGARHDTPDGDLSPPRRPPPRRAQPQGGDSPDLSPPRRRGARHDTPDGDLSPPRRRGARHDTPDGGSVSPPRRAAEPPSSSGRGGAEDLSPPRRAAGGGGRVSSPPARGKAVRGGGAEAWAGGATGLIKATELTAELAAKRAAERAKFDELSLEQSGRGAETLYRDKATGKKMTAEELKAKREAENAKNERIKPEWGGGMKQKLDAEARAEAIKAEAAKPFARYKDSAEVDAVYREKHVSRWGDPMAGKLKKAASFDLPPPEGFKVGGSGFKVPTAVPEHSWLRRGLGSAANRYNIRSGRHWDGVDRSNGYEAQLFKTMSERQSTQNAAYKWSVEDL